MADGESESDGEDINVVATPGREGRRKRKRKGSGSGEEEGNGQTYQVTLT